MRIDRSLRFGARAACALALAAAALLASGCSTSGVTTPKLPPLSRVTIAPHVDTLVVGGQRQFVAVAYDTGGTAVSGAAIGWRSSDAAVCAVSKSGLATAMGEGSALIVAFAGGKGDTARVYVKGATGGWATQTSNTTQNLNGVFFQPDGRTGFAVGDAGALVATADAGATWSALTSGTTFDLESVCFTDASTGWAVGKGGTVMKTVNGGASWTRLTNVGTTNNFFSVRFVDGAHVWAVGAGGAIARTIDGGASWTRHFPTAQPLYGVSFADTLNGWACGGGGVIVGTHDGGDSWYVVQPALTAQTFKSVAQLTASRAWAVGAQGVVAILAPTPDSLAWSLGNVGAANQLNGVHMVDALTGFAVGANPAGLVLRTTDGGTTWDPQVANSAQPLNGVYFVDALRGWAVGAAGRIVHTSRGGTP